MEEEYKYRLEQLETAALSRKKRLDWMIGIAITMLSLVWTYVGNISSENSALKEKVAVLETRVVEIGDDLDDHEGDPNLHTSQFAKLRDWVDSNFTRKD